MQAWKTISQPSLRNAVRSNAAVAPARIARVPQQPLLRRLHQQHSTSVVGPLKTSYASPKSWSSAASPMTMTRASELYLANQTSSRLSLARQTVRRGFASEAANTSTTAATQASAAVAASQKQTVSQRIKDMIKKYGYTALAVYLGISVLDLAATFVVVQALGMDKIKKAEDWAKENIGPLLGYKKKEEEEADPAKIDLDKVDDEQMGAIYNTASSLWSVFVIAYGIHKLLVPFRVVATSFVTPPLVKWLVKRGWIRDVTKKVIEAAATKSGAAVVATAGLSATTTSTLSEKEEEEQAVHN